MTATAHLNPVQWPIERVGQLQSANVPGLTVAEEYHHKEVLGDYTEGDHEHASAFGFSHPRDYQAALTEHVRQHGIANPVTTDIPDEHDARALGYKPGEHFMNNGYHRYAAARQLGHATVPVLPYAKWGTQEFAEQRAAKRATPGWNGSG